MLQQPRPYLPAYFPTSLPPYLPRSFTLPTPSPRSLLLQFTNLLATFVCCLFRCASFANFANFRQLNNATRNTSPPPPSCPLLRPPTAPPFCSPSPLPCWRCHWLQVSALLSFLLNTMEIAGPRLLFATPFRPSSSTIPTQLATPVGRRRCCHFFIAFC